MHQYPRIASLCSLSFSLAALSACGVPEDTQITQEQVLSSYAPQVGVCQWPNTVHLQVGLPGGYVGVCTGVVLRNGVMVTAGHCLYDAENMWIYFGENAAQDFQTVTMSEQEVAANCKIHPQGQGVEGAGLFNDELDWTGVDIAYCKLPSYPGGLPEGTGLTLGTCEESYFKHQVASKATFRLTGTGANNTNENYLSDFGRKMDVEVEAAGWEMMNGVNYLKVWQPDPCADTHIVRGGDSGSPIWMEMVDGSWRVVAIAAATARDYDNDVLCGPNGNPRYILATPLANHLPWIEAQSARDQTRCHIFDAVAFKHVYKKSEPFCNMASYITNPDSSVGKAWDDLACSDIPTNVSPYFSGQCAGWLPCANGTGTWPSCTTLTLGGNTDGSPSTGGLTVTTAPSSSTTRLGYSAPKPKILGATARVAPSRAR